MQAVVDRPEVQEHRASAWVARVAGIPRRGWPSSPNEICAWGWRPGAAD